MARWGVLGRVFGAGIFLAAAALASPLQAQTWRYDPSDRVLTLAAGPEDIQFIAQCKGGLLETSYFAPERPKIAAGLARPCNNDARPCLDEVPVRLLIDGQGGEIFASAEPEELYGGYTVLFSLEPSDPFWARMARGRTLSMRIAGRTGEALSLRGVSGPLGRLIAACGG